ncbi:segregation and condensation protein B [Hydrogenoanaerobacterium saccharovorans]|uniref:Segregation and condensation protein B n=1 Tax=Hydrogenoanaerobacterium saccharovorans TaxID=474960 RepID=A0A1H8D3M0_9FIRM|nr:SMC-Scp complex subunit ScpB [Hydrogenoanaerobacterium saccharovorans]RPF43468.1 segregation and condensation protein B [Hydrogenoanaerobacterium saccharovorans]SEN01786.1 segregation and condensation protein B [Hydrogenoanaerobacterium saccharovorans]
MRLNKIEKIAEAVLFASGEPVSAARLAQVLDCDTPVAYSILDRVRDHYDEKEGAVEILVLNDCYQMVTREAYAPYIRSALEIKRNQPLSQAALEVLAIIAYNQPVTKSFVEQVRGVDSASVVNTLVEKGLVEEKGRLELPGKPVAYVTTSNFLRCFGLQSLEQLPSLPSEDNEEDTEENEVDGQVSFDEQEEHDCLALAGELK